MPQYKTASATAYAVEDLKESSASLMAFICEAFPMPRLEIIERLIKIKSPSLINVQSWFIEYPPDQPEKKLIVIANQPRGPAVVEQGSDHVPEVPILELKDTIIFPIAEALKTLHDHQIPHRSVRPDNLFYTSDRKKKVCLGEGFTTPPAFSQPISFEPIASGMCDPQARGSGSTSDDIYALGMTVLSFLYGKWPGENLSIEEMSYKKLEYGSHSFFMSGLNAHEQMIPFLTGTLADNQKDRWTIDSVLSWLEGKAVRLLIGSSDLRSGRPKLFHDRDNFSCDELAYSMSLAWKDGLAFIQTDRLVNWIRFSVVDPQKTEEIEELLEQNTATGRPSAFRQNALMSKLLMHLSNKICIRWEGVSVMPSGLGVALAMNLAAGKPTKKLEEIIYARLPIQWDEAQRQAGNSPARLLFNFESLPRILDRKRIGYGIEAVTYMLNPSMPCLSPLVRKEYVTTIDDLLQALEIKVKNSVGENLALLDQHIMAFIVARTRILRDADLRSLMAQDPLRLALNRLKILSKLQTKSATDKVPNLASLLFKQTRETLTMYRHLPTKKYLEEACQRAVHVGDLAQLKNLVDNPALLQKDHFQFDRACRYYDSLTAEIVYIKDNILHNKSFSRTNSSKAYAIAVSSALSLLSLMGYFIYYFYYEIP